MKPTPEMLQAITRDLIDKGQVIAAGWLGYKFAAYSDQELPPLQHEEVRNAFFAGAMHLFSSIMAMLEPGDDETPTDLRRMAALAAELEAFEDDFRRKHGIAPRPTT